MQNNNHKQNFENYSNCFLYHSTDFVRFALGGF
jgi:hypothetical protein